MNRLLALLREYRGELLWELRPVTRLPARALSALMTILVRARLARLVSPRLWYGALAYLARREAP